MEVACAALKEAACALPLFFSEHVRELEEESRALLVGQAGEVEDVYGRAGVLKRCRSGHFLAQPLRNVARDVANLPPAHAAPFGLKMLMPPRLSLIADRAPRFVALIAIR